MAKKEDKKDSKSKKPKSHRGSYIQRQRRRRFALIIILLVLIAATLLYIYYFNAEESEEEEPEPKVSATNLSKTSLPNETVDYSFTIENPRDESDWFLIQVSGVPYGWDHSVEELISVGSKDKTTVDFNITTPVQSLNTTHHFTLNITSEHTQKTFSLTYSLTILRTYGVELETDKDEQYIRPGYGREYAVTVTNLGNNLNEISLSYDEAQIPVNWNFTMSHNNFTMSPFESRTIICNVTTHNETPLAIYPIELTASSDLAEDEKSSITLDTYLFRVHKLELKSLNSTHRADPGRSVFYTLIVKNIGNGKDDIRISYHKGHLPENWTLTIDNTELKLEEGETKALICNITTDVGSAASGGQFDIQINATVPGNDTAKTSTIVSITIDGFLEDRKIVEGDKVKVNYIGVNEDGRVFDTSFYYIAIDDENYPKADSFGVRPGGEASYKPLGAYIGAVDDNGSDEYGKMIDGFWMGMRGMKLHETKVVRIPPDLAYGDRTLIFEMTIEFILE